MTSSFQELSRTQCYDFLALDQYGVYRDAVCHESLADDDDGKRPLNNKEFMEACLKGYLSEDMIDNFRDWLYKRIPWTEDVEGDGFGYAFRAQDLWDSYTGRGQ